MTDYNRKTLSTREYEAFREAENDLTKKAVVVENTEPIPTQENEGVPLYFFNSEISQAGTEKEILLVSAYAGTKNRRIKKFGVSTHVEGTLRLYENDNFISSTRTNASKCDSEFEFESYIVLNGEIKIKFEARDNSANKDVDCFIMGNEI